MRKRKTLSGRLPVRLISGNCYLEGAIIGERGTAKTWKDFIQVMLPVHPNGALKHPLARGGRFHHGKSRWPFSSPLSKLHCDSTGQNGTGRAFPRPTLTCSCRGTCPLGHMRETLQVPTCALLQNTWCSQSRVHGGLQEPVRPRTHVNTLTLMYAHTLIVRRRSGTFR